MSRITAIVFDIDNTIIDTAVRKLAILKNLIEPNVLNIGIEDIRTDFHLTTLLDGNARHELERFYSILNSDRGIRYFQAPAIKDAISVLNALLKDGYAIIALTARHEGLRSATLEELKRLGLDLDTTELIMLPQTVDLHEPLFDELYDFKSRSLIDISKQYEILAYVGDRDSDAIAAIKASVRPFILISSSTNEELDNLKQQYPQIEIYKNWDEIYRKIKHIKSQLIEFKNLRNNIVNQYGAWLRDVDEKCRVTVMISTLLVGIAGNQILAGATTFSKIFLIIAFISALGALIFGIRGYTSRHTSGTRARQPISSGIKQWFAYLFNTPKSWFYLPGDPIDDREKMLSLPQNIRSKADEAFFLKQYKTLDPDTIYNIRLYDLRAVHYSKVYGERIASRLLTFGILSMFLWLIFFTIFSKTSPVIEKENISLHNFHLIKEELNILLERQKTLENLLANISNVDNKNNAIHEDFDRKLDEIDYRIIKLESGLRLITSKSNKKIYKKCNPKVK